jgi:RNA polymerase sigma factor (sigma-70 family)
MYQSKTWQGGRRHLGEEREGPSDVYEETVGRTVDELEQGLYNDSEIDYNYYIHTNNNGDKFAQAAIVKQYERLCHKQARKYAFTAPNHDHDDLVQEGRIGLLNAIKSFDRTNGASFMTWAFYHVRGSIAGCGRIDRKQPRFPHSIEDCPRAYNIEDPGQEIQVRDDVTSSMIYRILEECCGGLHTKRASIVMDRFGLLGRAELRNCECAEKYGLTKYAVNSHIYQFKKKAKARYPQLANFV